MCSNGIRTAIKQCRRRTCGNNIQSCPSNGKFVAFFCWWFFLSRADSRAPLKSISIFPLRTNYLSMKVMMKEIPQQTINSEVLMASWCALEIVKSFLFKLKIISNICIIDKFIPRTTAKHVLPQTRSCNILTLCVIELSDIKRVSEIDGHSSKADWKQKTV